MALTSGLFNKDKTMPAIQPVAQAAAAPMNPTPMAGWDYTMDPTYQAAMASGQSQFNFARNRDLASLQEQQLQGAERQADLKTDSAEARRRLAGSYAARGMAGGTAGALALAEARANAEQIANNTSIQKQLNTLNESFLQNYGATGGDWTGTLAGQQYKTSAIQEALNARLKGMGI